MKTSSLALADHIQNREVTTIASLVKITLTKYQPRIVSITKANPGVVTTLWQHGFSTGDSVKIVKVRGMTQVNDDECVITAIDPYAFSIGINTSGFSTYEKFGEARKIIGYTNFPEDLLFDNVTYRASLGYIPKSTKQGSDGSVDTVEISGIMQNAALRELEFLTIDGISDEDLMAGVYDNAETVFLWVNYEDLSMGGIILPPSGRVGQTTLNRGMYTAELRSKSSFLQEQIDERYSKVCRAELGDAEDDARKPKFGCKVRLDPLAWQASTAYTVRPAGDAALGSVVKPTVYNGRHFKCAVAGTSDSSEPTWNTVTGGTTVDGSVQWTTIDGLTKYGAVSAVIDRRRFGDLARNEAPSPGIGSTTALFPIVAVNPIPHTFAVQGHIDNQFPIGSKMTVVHSTANDKDYLVESSAINGANTWITVPNNSIPSLTADGYVIGRQPAMAGFFTHGKLTFLTGLNKGISREVRNFAIAGPTGPGSFELYEALPFDIAPGDAYEVTAGCDQSLIMCITKFDNVQNRRAEDNIPSVDSLLVYPDPK